MSESPQKNGSIHFYVVVESNSPKLDVASLGMPRLKKLIREQTEVRWNRQGDVRVIPRHVLMNTFRQYKDGLKMVDADRLGAVLATTHVIHWDQAEPLVAHASAQVDFAGDILPGVGHPRRKGSRVNAPA